MAARAGARCVTLMVMLDTGKPNHSSFQSPAGSSGIQMAQTEAKRKLADIPDIYKS